jgi:glycosyltransferase involved in cell wall biosynthesis
MSNKLLFISHDASRTGAPILLLNLLKELKSTTEYSFDIIFRDGGPLFSDFKQLATCYIWNKTYSWKSILKELLFRQSLAKYKSNRDKKRYLNKVESNFYQLVYSNSVKSADVLVEITENAEPRIIQHVHELEYMIRTFCDPEAFQKSIRRTSKFIAVSKIVQENLIQNHKVSKDKIEIIHAFVPNEIEIKKSRQQIRKELMFEQEDFVVVGSGTTDLRKGIDLFIQVAKQTIEKADVRFLWVGGDRNSKEFFIFQQDIQKLGLANNIMITGTVDNPHDYFNAGDVFLMTSREDPFPLVCLEAAQLKKPIICFENAIGSTEFITNENGLVVPYLNLGAMALGIVNLGQNSKLLEEKGEFIFLASRQYKIEVAFNKIIECINQTVQ